MICRFRGDPESGQVGGTPRRDLRNRARLPEAETPGPARMRGARRGATRIERPRSTARTSRAWDQTSDHLHHWLRRHPDVGARYESRGDGIPYQALPRSGSSGRDSAALERDRAAWRHTKEIAELRKRFDALTSREREVMNLVVGGWLNQQIGFELKISEITVKIHRGRVMNKMEAQSLAELVRMTERLQIPKMKNDQSAKTR